MSDSVSPAIVTPPSSASLLARGMLAIALMIGFYLLAAAIAAVLLAIPYFEWTAAHRLHIKLAFFCIAGAGVIVWSVLPRFDSFPAPGPLLTPDTQPRLFEVLEGVARATGQAMPREVYVIPEMNAWVAQRGGIMGFGSRRVMGLGLPLMQVLSVAELRAVIAHEFGHYHGGDTRLGPWVYKTRAAIGRTLDNMAGHSSVLQLPFVWYGKIFLLITNKVSRWQEFQADAMAARVAGKAATVSGLKKIGGAGMAFDAYWSNEVVPVLQRGYRPPIVDGFSAFMECEKVRTMVAEADKEIMGETTSDPYATHPPMAQRVGSLELQPDAGSRTPDDRAAVELLDDVASLEGDLLAALGGDAALSLENIGWAESAQKVYVPLWKEKHSKYGAAVAGITCEDLVDAEQIVAHVAERAAGIVGGPLPDDVRAVAASDIAGTALALLLHSKGHEVCCGLGEPISFRHESREIRPFAVLPQLLDGSMDAADWRDLCTLYGIAGADLGRAAG